MLFPYTYVPHKMEKMQSFINFIFYQVWCRAPKTGCFCLNLFDPNPRLKAVMTAFYYDHTEGGDFFYSHVENIYNLFANLKRPQIAQFKRWYQGNNDIEKICTKDPAVIPTRYADIPVLHKDLTNQISSFFKGLYSQKLLDLAALRDKIGDIDDHYNAFMGINKVGKCPFCGITSIQGIYHSTREAYDHYLPKGLYPFNSINFRNLVPACHHCNSSYKTSKNPAFTPKDPAGATHRRKVFYPYATSSHNIDISIKFSNPDIDHLTPVDIQLAFGPPALSEEIDTWKDVYGIEERYKAECCSGDAKAWLEEYRILNRKYSASPESYLETVNDEVSHDPFANKNFFKKAFIEGCDDLGILDAIAAGI